MSKQGSTLAGMMDAFSIAVSVGMQYGVPLETYVSKFTNMRFEPAGLTDDPDVRMAQSIVDYIFRRLALDFLPFETRSALGIHSAEERQRHLDTGSYESGYESGYEGGYDSGDDDVDVEGLAQSAPRRVEAPKSGSPKAEAPKPLSVAKPVGAVPAPKEAHNSTELLEIQLGLNADAPLCFSCGTKMRRAGSCYLCEGCGSTSGCS
jgi:ribonucleoside-diphosphate reductase alpha chain